MQTYSVSKKFSWAGVITDKVAKVMRMYGVTSERMNKSAVEHNCEVEIRAGDIVLITGPSGSGKSVILDALAEFIPADERINIDGIELDRERAVIDCVDGDFLTALQMLSIAGLSDVFCILNKPVYLSDGQQYRFRLAKALAAGKKYIIADEFCSNMDGITAAVICCRLRRFADKSKVTFLLASSREDVLADLLPDIIIERQMSGGTEVVYKETKRALNNMW